MDKSITSPRHTAAAGYRIGVLTLDTHHELTIGNVQNAESFGFPVLYEALPCLRLHQLMSADVAAEPYIRTGIESLQSRGARVIVGACGSFANWQSFALEIATVPVYMSVLAQMPFILAALPHTQRLGVVFASASSFTKRILTQCGLTSPERIVIASAEEIPAFREFMVGRAEPDHPAIEAGCISLLQMLQRRERNIGAWLFQCNELAPYAAAVQHATALPIFDVTLLVEHLHIACRRRPYG